MKTHDNQKPFQCTVCNRGYSTAAALTSHMQNHHKRAAERSNSPQISGPSYKCLQCTQIFRKPDELQVSRARRVAPLSDPTRLEKLEFNKLSGLMARLRPFLFRKHTSPSCFGRLLPGGRFFWRESSGVFFLRPNDSHFDQRCPLQRWGIREFTSTGLSNFYIFRFQTVSNHVSDNGRVFRPVSKLRPLWGKCVYMNYYSSVFNTLKQNSPVAGTHHEISRVTCIKN